MFCSLDVDIVISPSYLGFLNFGRVFRKGKLCTQFAG